MLVGDLSDSILAAEFCFANNGKPAAKSQRAVPQPTFRPTYSGKWGKDAFASEKRTGIQRAIKHGAVNIATR